MTGLETILYTVLIILIFLVIALAVVFVMVRKKEQEKAQANEDSDEAIEVSSSNSSKSRIKTKLAKEYETKSIFDFMEFEAVRDNMIVQNGGKRFLMAIECQGINYDLMSEVEKAATEESFATFLNTLRDPIQIYIQTRTINLEKNILDYSQKLEKIKEQLNIKEYRLKEYIENGNDNEKVIKDKQFEVFREKNLYTYGQDIVADTKKMSLNKNVLKKKYYIIIKYFYEPTDDVDGGSSTQAEIDEIAFSNLYTRAVSIISALSGIGVVGKGLDSYGLVELLYNAYNRDDSETFGIGQAIEAGYNEIYIDSQNVIDKKIEVLNKEIELRSQEQAKAAVQEIMDERSEELKNIEENLESIIEDLAKKLIEEERNIPQAVKDEAIERIQNQKEENESNGKKTKETIRKRRAS